MTSLALALPLAVALALIAEARLVRRRGLAPARIGSMLSNLGCGALRGIVALSVQGSLIGAYGALHARAALFDFDLASPLAWLAAFVAYDFTYYWVHRLSHRIPLLWAAHAVHHQATELEPSVLFRAPIVAPLQAFPLYALLAVLGVPPAMYVAVAVFEHAVMFWLHTRVIGDVGRVGAVLNTPAHHRVHHAADIALGRANYGGVLIVWDRLFGTFRRDPGVVRFGIEGLATPLGPVRANIAPWLELLAKLREARGSRRVREQPLARHVVHLQPNAVRIFE
jgi:sterol desaturase/sphingolipid hydroxylase (fatty acid hydroxylase superfamily)